jgi:hypothetical protein
MVMGSGRVVLLLLLLLLPPVHYIIQGFLFYFYFFAAIFSQAIVSDDKDTHTHTIFSVGFHCVSFGSKGSAPIRGRYTAAPRRRDENRPFAHLCPSFPLAEMLRAGVGCHICCRRVACQLLFFPSSSSSFSTLTFSPAFLFTQSRHWKT